MRECELCGVRARIHCEADQANLCWGCDEKVHGANFLVAKHPRSLLCHGCQLPTPWTGTGTKLTPTVSVCETCVRRRGSKIDRRGVQESEGDNEEDDDDDDDDDDVDDEDDDDDDHEEEDENQVVPWSCCSYSAADPPPALSCSSREGEEEEFSVSTKRMQGNADVDYSDSGCEETASLGSLRELKRRRLGEENCLRSERSGGAVNDGGNGDLYAAKVIGICKLSRDDRSHSSSKLILRPQS